MSSVAMMLATKGVNTNPSVFNSWLRGTAGRCVVSCCALLAAR